MSIDQKLPFAPKFQGFLESKGALETGLESRLTGIGFVDKLINGRNEFEKLVRGSNPNLKHPLPEPQRSRNEQTFYERYAVILDGAAIGTYEVVYNKDNRFNGVSANTFKDADGTHYTALAHKFTGSIRGSVSETEGNVILTASLTMLNSLSWGYVAGASYKVTREDGHSEIPFP